MNSFKRVDRDLGRVMSNLWGLALMVFLLFWAAKGIVDTFVDAPAVCAKGSLKITQDGEYLIYPAAVTRVVDGDTVDLQFRIWPDTIREARIRMIGINAPEVRGASKEQGLITAAYLRSRLTGSQVYLKTDGKEGKYGRLLGILLVEEDGKLVDVSQELIAKGLAQPYN